MSCQPGVIRPLLWMAILVLVPARGTDAGPVTMSNVNTSAGLTSTFTQGNTHDLGMAWVDYNNDYWPDIFITNGGGLDHFLYRNNGDGTFTDVSSLVAKPDLALESAGVVFGDIDNDGDSDIFVPVDNPQLAIPFAFNPPGGGPNLLYVNQGDGTFIEQASAAGLLDPSGRRTIDAAFCDYDRDGYLDVYCVNWEMMSPQINNFDRMLHNDGDGTFTDVTSTAGTDGLGRDGLTCMWFDVDLDGWPDLYVGNILTTSEDPPDGPNSDDILYLNCRQTTTFCDGTGDPSIIGNDAPAAMGLDVGDIDNDGDWDLYVTDIPHSGALPVGNVLYLGNPDGSLTDNVADVAGVLVGHISWPCLFLDFDFDGWVDLWVGTATPDEAPIARDFIFLNDQDGTFTDVGETIGFTRALTLGGAAADYDGDGDMDIFAVNDGADSVLYRNNTPIGGNWIEFKLFGTISNRDAIGAIVRVTAESITQMRQISGGHSAHSQSDLIVHFGVNLAATVDVGVTWPNGLVENFAGVASNQLVFIEEQTGILTEAFTCWDAAYDSGTQDLLVRVKSSFGGRPGLTATGFGSLSFRADLGRYETTFAGVPSNPGTVTVQSTTGISQILTVEEGPVGQGPPPGPLLEDVPTFVSVLIGADVRLCVIPDFDYNGDGSVDGPDVQMFVDLLLTP